MSNPDKEKRIRELPERVRLLIDREMREGLPRVRSREFESRLAARLTERKEQPLAAIGRRRLWKPTLAVAGAAALVLVAVLWISRTQPGTVGSAADAFAVTLGRTPGVQNLEISVRPIPPAGEAPSESAILVCRALASASQSAASGPRTQAPSLENLKPRYGLRQKMEILFGQRMIERALLTYKDKFREV
jgi:hypothetical protein